MAAALTNMRVISSWVPASRAQLRFDDVDGYRLIAFATNTRYGSLADLEVRHRQRARIEDRIRIGKDTGLAKMPLQGFAANQIWCHIVTLALDLLAWMQALALASTDARRWEPKTLRHRLFTIPAILTRQARQYHLNLAKRAPWAHHPQSRRRAGRTRPGSPIAKSLAAALTNHE